jgi:type II restriction endonuclease EcoO109I-like protein
MSSSKIENLVRQSFDEFYRQRLMKLTGVMLSDLFRKKNLYLLCATSGFSVSKIVEKMLEEYISSSDENIFGQAFFESIASIEREETALSGEKSNIAYKAITLINVLHYIPIQSWIEFEDEWAKALNRLRHGSNQCDTLNNSAGP